MFLRIFCSGIAVLGLGFVASRILTGYESLGFLQGALSLGGGLIICALFSLKSTWHGTIGAGILALLGAARGLSNLPDLLPSIAGTSLRGKTPILEAGITAICFLLMIRVLGVLQRERTRRMLEQAETSGKAE